MFYLTMVVLSLIFVILSGSRGALAACVAFIFFNILYYIAISKQYKSKVRYALIISISLLGLVLMANFFYISSGLLEYMNLLPNRLGSLTLDTVTTGGRLATWPAILSKYISIIKLHPLILFVGMGSGGFYEIIGERANGADSQFIYTIIAGGVIGFIFYIESLFRFYRFALIQMNIQLKSIFISMFFSFMVFSLTQEVFILSKTGGLFWSVCGILFGCSYNSTTEKSIFRFT